MARSTRSGIGTRVTLACTIYTRGSCRHGCVRRTLHLAARKGRRTLQVVALISTLLVGTAACVLAAWLRVSRVEWAVIVFTIALVIILEGLNTAVEAATG